MPLCLLILPNLSAQSGEDFSFTTKSEYQTETKDFNLTITVRGEDSNYSYYIYNKEMWNGGKLKKQATDIQTKEYVFTSVKKGSYFVCVMNSEQIINCNKIVIEK